MLEKLKKTPIKNKILEDYLIDGSHNLKSLAALAVAGIISIFGVYSVIMPFFVDDMVLNTNTLTITIIALIGVMIVFDSIKRGSLTKFFNSKLKKKIISSPLRKGYLVVAVSASTFMFLLGVIGSYATAQKASDLWTQSKTNASTEFQILQQNAESGKTTASNYKLELQTWRESRTAASANCNDKWKGWKSKYKATCKEEWSAANPMPQQTATGHISIQDYKSIKKAKQGFLDEWLFTFVFILLLLLTLLTEYLTISSIYDYYNDIDESLTFERIEFINDIIQEHETILSEHEQKTAEMMANAQREKNTQDMKFQKVGEAIAIENKRKNVETRGKTVKRIANNQYVPTEHAKAGFIKTSFSEKDLDFHLGDYCEDTHSS